MPKISVIMPVYNGEAFIASAIDSLLSQTFQDWELIVVDDGSIDNTSNILAQYMDTRIRVVRQNNGGEAAARNTGLDHMGGEYMAFLDADDLYFPNALFDMFTFLEEHYQYDSIYSNGYITDNSDQELMQLTDIRPGIFTGNILEMLVITPSVVTVPVCTMTRVSIVREYNMRFDTTNNLIGTDWDFWIRLGVHAQFGYLDKITCKYRIHQTNITRTYGSEKRKRDYIYCRMKVMNSDWFVGLSVHTRELFFLDLLTVALSGHVEQQQQILSSYQFTDLPTNVRSTILRMVGIDALQTGRLSDIAKRFLLEASQLNPADTKTRFILGSLKIGYLFTLTLVKFWRLSLQLLKKISVTNYSRTKRLQKMLGFQ